MSETTGRPLTYGEKAVGISFNPGRNPLVNNVKYFYAKIIDDLKTQQTNSESPEQKRHYAVAITEAETAQMRAEKAITWVD